MDRISGANYFTSGGIRIFIDLNLGTNTPGTFVNALWCNGVQESILGVVTAAGLVPTDADNTQLLHAIQTLGRIKLTANTTFYVATTGNDTTGNGTAGTPWATIQHAVNTVMTGYDLGGYVVTFACTGNFTAGCNVGAAMVGQTGPEQIIFDGGGTANIAVVSADCFGCSGGACFVVQNWGTLSTSGSAYGGNGDCIACNLGCIYFKNVTFGSCVGAHIGTYGSGALISAIGNYAISGGAAGGHLNADFLSSISIYFTLTAVTISGTPAFPAGFAIATSGGVIVSAGITWGTGATGPRYAINSNATIVTNGSGANYFPGNATGANDGTAVYV